MSEMTQLYKKLYENKDIKRFKWRHPLLWHESMCGGRGEQKVSKSSSSSFAAKQLVNMLKVLKSHYIPPFRWYIYIDCL